MIRRPPRSTLSSSSAASDVYKRQVRGRRRDEVLAAADRPAGVNGAALLLEKRTRDAEVEVSEAERGDLAFHEALPVLELRAGPRLGQALAGPLEAGADFRAPRLGKFFHAPADVPRLDLGDRDDLAAARAAPLPARDDPSLRAGTFRGEADEAVRDPLKNRQERLQPRRCRGEGQLHLDLVVPDLHSDADVHLIHGVPASPSERVAPASTGSNKNLPGRPPADPA